MSTKRKRGKSERDLDRYRWTGFVPNTAVEYEYSRKNASFGTRNTEEIKRKDDEWSTLIVLDKVNEMQDKLLSSSKNDKFKQCVKKLESLDLSKNSQIVIFEKQNIDHMKKLFSEGQGLGEENITEASKENIAPENKRKEKEKVK
eukprot:UN07428